MHELTELLGHCSTPNELYHYMTQATPLELVVQTSTYSTLDPTPLPTPEVNLIPTPIVVTPSRESTHEDGRQSHKRLQTRYPWNSTISESENISYNRFPTVYITNYYAFATPWTQASFLQKQMHISLVPFKHLMILFTSSQCFLQGLAIYC